MADLPILFSAPMVRALLREIEKPGTGKTQSRRIIKPRGKGLSLFDGTWEDSYVLDPGNASWRERDVPVQPGDRLYVREHWNTEAHYDDLSPSQMGGEEPIKYKADGRIVTHGFPAMQRDGRHRHGMHMPRWASRITLIVTDVRVERLQEISEADAIAEGCFKGKASGRVFANQAVMHLGGDEWANARDLYADLWDSINGPGAWEANPWVVAYTFTPILGNIDQIGGRA